MSSSIKKKAPTLTSGSKADSSGKTMKKGATLQVDIPDKTSSPEKDESKPSNPSMDRKDSDFL